MKTLKFLLTSCFGVALMVVGYSANAATWTQFPDYNTGTVYGSYDGGGAYVSPNPYYAILVDHPKPAALSGSDVQNVINETPVSFTVTDFTSSGGNTYPGLTSSGTTGSFDPGFAFQGFLIKAGTKTLITLFNSPITSIDWNTFFAPNKVCNSYNAMSHIAFFNVSEVPVPAALWMFVPALLGFFGLRRKYQLT